MASSRTTTDEPPTDENSRNAQSATDAEATRDASPRPFPARRARTRAILWILALTLAGFAVSYLDRTDPKPPTESVTVDELGSAVYLIADAEKLMAGKLDVGNVRFVMSRLPIDLDTRHWTVTLVDGTRRTIPAGASIVLVGDHGAVEPIWLDQRALQLFFERVLRNWGNARTSDWRSWFAQPENRAGLGSSDDAFAGFWLRP